MSMPVKMQYPVQLHKDTKCPMCNTELIALGGAVYACQTGHVIEGYLLVTMKPKPAQPPVQVENTNDEENQQTMPGWTHDKATKQ